MNREPLSSNPILAEMRRLAGRPYGWSDVAIERFGQAAAEIERLTSALHEATRREATLTAERDAAHKLSANMEGHYRRVLAERDRLTAELAAWKNHSSAQWTALTGERDRLRASLLNLMVLIRPLIDKPHGISSDEGAILDAREALAGAAEETSAQLGPMDSRPGQGINQMGSGPCGYANHYARCILMRGHDGKHELQ